MRAIWPLLALLVWACVPPPVSVEAPVPAAPPAEAPAPAPPRLASLAVGPADRVLVVKGERRLYLLRDGAILGWMPVALGRDPEGPKQRRGDWRTPEGEYVLDARNPASRFHRSIHISYPNEADMDRALAAGLDPGGDIHIHGTPDPALLGRDWTIGCIAVGNDDMDLLWVLVPPGTPITIRP